MSALADVFVCACSLFPPRTPQSKIMSRLFVCCHWITSGLSFFSVLYVSMGFVFPLDLLHFTDFFSLWIEYFERQNIASRCHSLYLYAPSGRRTPTSRHHSSVIVSFACFCAENLIFLCHFSF